jgi:hypothetical protein
LQFGVDAVERHDDQLLRAIDEAPRAFPLLRPEHQSTLRQVRLERAATAPLLAQLRDELAIHVAMFEAAESDLQRGTTRLTRLNRGGSSALRLCRQTGLRKILPSLGRGRGTCCSRARSITTC